MLLYENFHHLNEREIGREDNWDEKQPTYEGDGEPLLIPYSAHFSKQVLNFTKL